MKFIVFTVFFFMCFILLTSCKKSENTVTPPLISNQDSTLLKSFIEIDSTLPAPKDTIYRGTYTYDKLNRLSTQNEFFSNRFTGDTTYIINTKFEYTGTDTFATRKYKIAYYISQSRNLRYTINDTVNYVVANGNIISDSSNTNPGDGSGHFSLALSLSFKPNLIVTNLIQYSPNAIFVANDSIHFEKNNENITYQIDTAKWYYNDTISVSTAFETRISYLPNPNPLYKILRPVIKQVFDNYGIGNNSFDFAPKHLISYQTGNRNTTQYFSFNTITSQDPESIRYDYVFRADGYPIKAWVNQMAGTESLKTKLIFVYY